MKAMLTTRFLAVASGVLLGVSQAIAAVPYTPVPVSGPPIVGPGVSAPDGVYGKEYSHDPDMNALGLLDPEQVMAWDGIGGVADTIDYTGTRPNWEADQQVDAIANSRDALFDETLRDESHLIFSHDDLVSGYGFGGPTLFTVPSGGPVFLSNGAMIGGAGDVSIEASGLFVGAPAPQGIWAKQPEVNLMPLPRDVDGLEVWGPEPRKVEEPELPVIGDADKYSLDVDVPSGASVWNAAGTAYIGWPTIVSAVESLLGPVPASAFSLRDDHQGRQAINLDALMVSDIIEETDVFHQDIGDPIGSDELLDQNGEPIMPFGHDGEVRGDSIIFSIRQIIDPMDPDGYYSTGSELFVLDSLKGVSFLKHGGHVWDHGYALSDLRIVGGPDGQFEGDAVIDINAIEAIGEEVGGGPIGLPGDYNADSIVDAADYTVWRDNLGTAFPLAGNGDETGSSMGVVDDDDYLLWRSNYGAMAPGPAPVASSAAAPEPASLLLLLGVAAAPLAWRKR